GADDGLLDQVRRVFGDLDAGARGHQHGNAARLAELERRDRIAVDEGRFHRRFMRRKFVDHAAEPVMDGDEPPAERHLLARLYRAAGNKDQPVALSLDQAPAGAAEPRIDAEDANRAAHATPLIARTGCWAYRGSVCPSGALWPCDAPPGQHGVEFAH